MKRRSAIFVLLVCCSVHEVSAAQSQAYPTRPVRVIAAQSAGSSLDTLVRIVTPKLSELLGQQLVIDNRGGAGGTIGIELAARAVPDGHTALVGASSSMIVSRFSYRSLPFDVLKDFDPVSNLVNADAVLVVHPAVPAKSLKELIALAKSQPGKLNMSSAGVGSSSHLAGIMLNTPVSTRSTCRTKAADPWPRRSSAAKRSGLSHRQPRWSGTSSRGGCAASRSRRSSVPRCYRTCPQSMRRAFRATST